MGTQRPINTDNEFDQVLIDLSKLITNFDQALGPITDLITLTKFCMYKNPQYYYDNHKHI